MKKIYIRDLSWFSFWASAKETACFQRLTSWTGPRLDEEIGEEVPNQPAHSPGADMFPKAAVVD